MRTVQYHIHPVLKLVLLGCQSALFHNSHSWAHRVDFCQMTFNALPDLLRDSK